MPEKNLQLELQNLIDALLKEGGLTTANMAKLGKFTKENPDFINSDEARAEMEALQAQIQSSPQQQKLMQDILRKRQSDRVAAQVAPFVQAILVGSDITSAAQQIRSGRAAGARLRKPLRPTPVGATPELDSAISDARGRVNEVDTNVLNALRLQNLDSYLGDLQNAKTASGGQAGLYGSLAQAAVNRRNRANLASVPVLSQLQAQNRARYDRLLGSRAALEQARVAQEIGLYGADLQQYNNEALGAGRLEATGRSNLRNSMYNAGAVLPGMIGAASTVRPNLGRISMRRPDNMAQDFNDAYSEWEASPSRYTPDVYELGSENAPYLNALQEQHTASVATNTPPIWNYKIRI